MEEQIKEILNDNYITDYFKSKNLANFLKLYIEIDKILSIENYTIKPNPFYNQILEKLDDLYNKINLNPVDNISNILNNHPLLTNINNNVTNINKRFISNSANKGKLAENDLFNVLTDTFLTSQVINTSQEPHKGDIQIFKDNNPTILIDNKNFSTSVPKIDIEKFYSDIQLNDCCGILCNTFGGISNKEHLEIEIIGSHNLVIYIHKHLNDPDIFKFAINVLYNIHKNLNIDDKILVDEEFFQDMKQEYTQIVNSYRLYIENMQTNLNSMKKLSFDLTDRFFKTKIGKSKNNKFNCPACHKKFKTDDSLNKHIKNTCKQTPKKQVKDDTTTTTEENVNILTF